MFFETQAKFDYLGRTYEVKVTDGELKTLEYVPEANRGEAKRNILRTKAQNLIKAAERRTTFTSKLSEDGKRLSIYGLGQRFPVTMTKQGWNVVFENMEGIKAEVAKLKA